MSKATHAFSAPACALHPTYITTGPTRRAALTGGAAAACLAGQAGSSGLPAADLETIRSHVQAYWAAVGDEIALEGSEGHGEACERSERLYGHLEALAGAIRSQPVTPWADVARRAELCRMFYSDDGAELQASLYPGQQALGNLLTACLTMGARHA